MGDADDENLKRAERVVGNLLRAGVLASLALLVVGTLLSFHHGRYGTAPADVRRILDVPSSGPHTPGAILHGLHDWRGQAFLAVGLLVLIATPILRVAVSVATFTLERDWPFAIITAMVLALLVLSCALGTVE